jgi:hypothetical protein
MDDSLYYHSYVFEVERAIESNTSAVGWFTAYGGQFKGTDSADDASVILPIISPSNTLSLNATSNLFSFPTGGTATITIVIRNTDLVSSVVINMLNLGLAGLGPPANTQVGGVASTFNQYQTVDIRQITIN